MDTARAGSPMKYSASFIRRADEAHRRVVLDRGYCERCGRTDMLTTAHLERRRFHATRWLPEAALCLCLPCHTWYDTERTESDAWLRERIGDEARDELYRLARSSEYEQPEAILARLKSMTSGGRKPDRLTLPAPTAQPARRYPSRPRYTSAESAHGVGPGATIREQHNRGSER